MMVWAGEDSNLWSRKTADLQSAPFGRSGTCPCCRNFTCLFSLHTWTWKIIYLPLKQKKSQRRDSNPRPADYKSAALPAELLWLITFRCDDVPCHHHQFYKKQRTTRFFWEGKGNGNLEMQKFCWFIFNEECTIRYVYALQGKFCSKFERIPMILQSPECGNPAFTVDRYA